MDIFTFSNSLDDYYKNEIINLLKSTCYEYGLRIIKRSDNSYFIYWDKYHFNDVNVYDIGINYFNFKEKAEEKLYRLLR